MIAATAWVNETTPAKKTPASKLEWSAEGTAADVTAEWEESRLFRSVERIEDK